MPTQAELIESWEKEAESLYESSKKDLYMSRETEERVLERAATLQECANNLKGLTYG